MGSEHQLLTDEQMRQFITEGYLILKTDFSKEFHQQLLAQLNHVYEKEGNPGNNLLPRIQELQKVFDHPIITGALASVLGEKYMLHAHRHGHYNSSPKPGGWHKDSYWGHSRTRNLHPWWAMIMYFPQDTPIELGPTGIMPGTQYYESRTFEGDEHPEEAKASGEAGTFALIHYDIWHRSTANVAGQDRYMLKFEFMRTQAPTAPSWDNKDKEWMAPASFTAPIHQHELLWKETWNWLSGHVGSIANKSVEEASPETVVELSDKLMRASEPEALNAAYELAATGEEGIKALLQVLEEDSVSASRTAAYGLSAAGEPALIGLLQALDSEKEETLIHAAFALGELRELAAGSVFKLISLFSHRSKKVRIAIVESLGMIGVPNDTVTKALATSLQDEDPQVRFMAGLSITRLGSAAENTVPQLVQALEDDDRYVRAHAAEALYYIGTPKAKDALLDFLRVSRWCPTTTPASTF
jgi:hypothetical protein